MRVCAVGDATYLGGISGELQSETRESPLRARLTVLARQISRVGYAAAVVCALAFLFHAFVPETGFDRVEILQRMQDLSYVGQALLHALTLALTVLLAKLAGCLLPLGAKRIGLDPAVMASPFITTIVDTLSLLVYFAVATALIPELG